MSSNSPAVAIADLPQMYDAENVEFKFSRLRKPYQARPFQSFARPGRVGGGGGLRGPDAINQG